MAETTKDSAKLPDTKPYRVAILAASYMKPIEGYDRDNKPAVVHVWAHGVFGEEVELTEAEARRLTELGAVLPAGSPLTYEEMNEKQLEAVAKERGINVPGTGAKGGVLRSDYLNALRIHDQGAGLRAEGAPVVEAEPAAE